MALMYCKKCGRIVQGYDEDNCDLPCYCDCCKAITYPVPEKYWLDGLDFAITNQSEKQLIEELVKPSPEFDQQLFDNRGKILAQKNAEYNRVMSIGKAIQNGAKPEEVFKGNYSVAKCPSCGSTNVSKIGIINRAVSVGIFGLASGKIGKNHKCNSCGTTW